MHQSRVLGPSAVVTLLLASGGVAQTMQVPMGYMWASHVPPGADNASNAFITPMVHVNVKFPVTVGGISYDIRTIANAFQAGRWAALEVKRKGLPAGRVCVLIQNWGQDDDGCDSGEGQSDPQYDNFFFRADDRILPKDNEWADESVGGFPEDRSEGNDGRTARYYRHPFLTNAGGNPNYPTYRPLRDWTRQFLLGYKAEKATQAGLGFTVPRPDLFTFDVEPGLNQINNRNALHLLRTVAVAQNSNIWNSWTVPGYGLSLRDLYQLRVSDGVFNWPSSILDPTNGIQPNLVEFDGRNGPFIVWWNEICFRALNEVMRVSAYEPIHDPNYGWGDTQNGRYLVRCGNYRDMQADGLSTFGAGTERVSWYQDRPDGFNYPLFPREFGTASVAKDSLPRYQMHPLYGGYQLWAGGTQRYLGIRQWSSGDMDSPVLYPENLEQFNYIQQADYYLPDHTLDATPFDSSRRVSRRAVETALNSNVQGSGNSWRLVPWLQMSSTNNDGNPNEAYTFLSEEQLREQLRLLRSKNARDALFWTNPPTVAAPPPPEHPQYQRWQNLIRAWDETQEALHRVYSGRVVNYARASGPAQLPPPNGNSAFDVSRLEFTLADPTDLNKQDYEVEVKPNIQIILPFGSNQFKYTTAIVVEFEWTDPFVVNDHVFDYQIESSVRTTDPATVSGKVWYWWEGQYHPIAVAGTCSPDNTYTFNAPKTVSDERYRARVSFPKHFGYIWYDSATNTYKSRLKLEHTTTITGSQPDFMSWFDLVQMTPVGGGSCGGSSMMSISVADSNSDGIVEYADLVEYSEIWLDNGAAADLSLDGLIDDRDFDQYVEAYVRAE